MGYPAQVSDDKVRISVAMGSWAIQFTSFFGRRKIRVDVDLIDDTSCLHGAISIFNAQKTDPQRSSLSGGLVQTGETLSSPVL